MTTTTNDNDDNNNNDKKNKKKKRSMFSEAAEVEQKLKVAKRKADADRSNSLTTENARDVAALLLAKALRESFAKSDKEQGRGIFIHGSMQRLHSGMWKGLVEK